MTVEALARPRPAGGSAALCGALVCAGNLHYWSGRYGEARRYGEERLAVAQEIDDKRRIERAIMLLGMACEGLADSAGARAYREQALALAREIGDPQRLSWALDGLAEMFRAKREFDAAAPLYGEALALQREHRNPHGIGLLLVNVTLLAIGRGRASDGHVSLFEAHAIARDDNLTRLGIQVLDACSGLAALVGEWERAARIHGSANAYAQRVDHHREPADEATLRPRLTEAREALGEAAFVAATANGRALPYDEAMADVGAWLARAWPQPAA